MRKIPLITLAFIVIVLTSCSSFSPEPTPTPEPKPTWTMHPHGVLLACIYFKVELVPMGYLTFFNEYGPIEYLSWVELIDGCKDIVLTPGRYEVSAKYFQGVCADTGGGWMQTNIIIQVKDGDVIKQGY